MTKERYYELMDQLGTEVEEDRIPKDLSDLPLSFQSFVAVFSYLPDKYDGMSGTYLGKDLSPLDTILDIFEVKDKLLAIRTIKVLEGIRSKALNAKKPKQAKKRSM